MIASSYCRTSCPGGEVGLAWVALAPGLRRETEFTRCWAPKPSGVGGTESASLRAPSEWPRIGVLPPLASASLGLCASPGAPRREMAALIRGKDSSRYLLLLAAVLMVESSQLGSSRAKLNSIKSSLGGETPIQASNRSAGTYQGLAFGGSKKGKNLGQVGKYPQCTLQPGEGGTSALESIVAFARPLTFRVRSQVCRAQLGRGSQSRSARVEVAGGCWCWRVWSQRVTVLSHLCFGTWACTEV